MHTCMYLSVREREDITKYSVLIVIMQCAQEMQHIIRLARRDGDEWVRLFAGILAPFPNSQSIAMDVCLEGSMEGVVEEIGEARMCACTVCICGCVCLSEILQRLRKVAWKSRIICSPVLIYHTLCLTLLPHVILHNYKVPSLCWCSSSKSMPSPFSLLPFTPYLLFLLPLPLPPVLPPNSSSSSSIPSTSILPLPSSPLPPVLPPPFLLPLPPIPLPFSPPSILLSLLLPFPPILLSLPPFSPYPPPPLYFSSLLSLSIPSLPPLIILSSPTSLSPSPPHPLCRYFPSSH